jgi:hypothetical protein
MPDFCPAPSQDNSSLSSLWGGLSPHLIASFWEVAKAGAGEDARWERVDGKPVVYAPLSEASLEMSLNWQSPFEASGTTNIAPTLMAMLQSGYFQPVLDMIVGNGKSGESAPSSESQTGNRAREMLTAFENRTGVTKINSTQIFSGEPPVKIQVTALFRAWRDAVREVETPIAQLMQWALPEHLEKDGALVNLIDSKKNWIDVLMPSKAPSRIAMKYKNRLYSPLVIESISQPLQSDVDSNGRYVQMAVPMTLCSLTAIDRNDWQEWGKAGGG